MPDQDELLRQIFTQLPAQAVEFMDDLAAWATPERVSFVLQITEKVANSILPKQAWKVIPSNSPEAQELAAQPGYVMLRELATGRKSVADGEPWRFPEEHVQHFCRLWTMIATNSITGEVAHFVEIVHFAEQRLEASPQDSVAQRAHATAYSQLDEALDRAMAANEEINFLVTIVFLFLFTDDPDQALRVEVP